MSDLFADTPFSREDKIGELRREIGMREQVYGRQVAAGRMNPDRAEFRIEIMRAILSDYVSAGALEGTGR
jgi:hypothetical protein